MTTFISDSDSFWIGYYEGEQSFNTKNCHQKDKMKFANIAEYQDYLKGFEEGYKDALQDYHFRYNS